MPLIRYTQDGKVNMVNKAVKRIKEYSAFAEQFTGKPYFVAYSAGKDSDVIRILCQLADVPHELVHSHTTIDAPPTIQYLRTIPDVQIIKPKMSMWDLIVKKRIPPLRHIRYCCTELKELHGKDRFVITGVRWDESVKRKKNRGSLEILGSNTKNNLILHSILHSDNGENRRLFETCMKKGKRVLNPIIEWDDSEVWEFLDYYGCESNPLYKMGYHRVGCIGCPNARKAGRLKEFEDFPKYKDMYIRAFDRMLKVNSDKTYSWNSGEEVFYWWLSDKPVQPPK